MSTDLLYTAINLGVMPAWLLLVFAPRSKVTRKLVHSFLYPFVYGGFYIAFLTAAIFFNQGAEGAGMSDIAGVTALFSAPVGVLTGWTHYLVFDLFVGAWISRDAVDRKIPHLLIVPILAFTLMFGPVGLFLYGMIRLVMGRRDLSLSSSADE